MAEPAQNLDTDQNTQTALLPPATEPDKPVTLASTGEALFGTSGILDKSALPFSSGEPGTLAGADERVGLFDSRTLGESMEESLEQQRSGVDMAGFQERINAGQIEGVGNRDATALSSMVAAANDESNDAGFRANVQNELNVLMDVYNQSRSIGPKTAYGTGTFEPTVTEEEDPALYSKQEIKFIANQKILGAVLNKFDSVPGLTPDDTDLIEETMTQLISTGSMSDGVQEAVNENIIRGSILFGSDLLFSYTPSAITAATEWAVRGMAQAGRAFGDEKPYFDMDYKTAAKIWREDAPVREMIQESWRKLLSDEAGVRTLGAYMDDALRQELEVRLANDPERLNRILNPAIVGEDGQEIATPTGGTLRGKRTLVTEDIAQNVFNASLETLTESEQFGVAAIDTAAMMLGTTKARLASDTKELARVRNRIDAVIAKGGRTAKRLENLPTGQQLLILQQKDKAFKFNKRAVANALELEKAQEGFTRISDEVARISTELDDRRTLDGKVLTYDMPEAGFNKGDIYKFADDLEIETLRTNKESLISQRFQSKILMDGMPVIKTTISETLPMAAAQYLGGEFLQGLTDGDRLTAQGIAAVAYLIGGPTAINLASRVGGGVNSYFGNPAANVGIAVQDMANVIASPALGPDFFTGVLVDEDMVKYRKLIESHPSRGGKGLTYAERKALKYMQKLSTVLDDDSRAMVKDSLKQYQKLQARILNAFEEGSSEYEEANAAFRETFATMSNMGWMRSAQQLALSKISSNALNSEAGINEAEAMFELQTQTVTQAKLALDNFRRLIKRDVVDPDDKQMLEDYMQTLEETIRRGEEGIAEGGAQLNRNIEDLIDMSTEDTFQEVTPEILEKFVSAGVNVNKRLRKDLDEMAYRNGLRTRINEGLARRAENLKKSRVDEKRSALTSSHFETVIMNNVARFKGLAKRGFKGLDARAEKENTTINIGSMIKELYEFAKDDPDGGATLSTFFSPEGKFFSGALGKRVNDAFNAMSKRWADSLGKETFDGMMQNASIEFLEDGSKNALYIKDVTPLKLLMYHMDKSGFTGFQAAPGEVMDVYSAFRDYAIGVGNGRLAHQYETYEGRLLDIVKSEAPEYFREWQAAADLYKAEWFDRFQRMDGAGSKFLKSQKFGALTERVGPSEESDFVRLFRFGYGATSPDTFLRPLANKINAAARNPSAMNRAPVRDEIRRLLGEFANKGPNGELFFDAADKDSMAVYGAISTALTEFVYDTWARETLNVLDREKGLEAITEILPANMDGIKDLQGIFNVRLVNGNTDTVSLVDFEGMISEGRKFGTLLKVDKEVRDAASKTATRIKNEINRQEKTINSVTAVGDAGLKAVSDVAGIGKDGAKFLKEYFETGDPRKVDAMRLRAKLALSGGDATKTTTTITRRVEGEDVSFEVDIDEVIDAGISQLLVDGLLQKGGLQVLAGETRRGDIAEIMSTPGELAKFLNNDVVARNLADYLGDDHVQYLQDIAFYMNLKADSVMAKYDPKITNLVSGFGTNQLISRAFNIRRGMVSPQYVAAELAVSMASKAGIDLMKMAATDKDGARFMHRFMEFPKDMTKADLDVFSAKLTTFIVTEFGKLGYDAEDYLPDALKEVGVEATDEVRSILTEPVSESVESAKLETIPEDAFPEFIKPRT